jgi:predicted nuclease of predicted toxin-antitoxin system
VKLLFDENLSRKLVARLAELYPDSAHVAEAGLLERPDREIWEFARARNFVIVSTDSDFYELATTIGPPPKVVWLRRLEAPDAGRRASVASVRPSGSRNSRPILNSRSSLLTATDGLTGLRNRRPLPIGNDRPRSAPRVEAANYSSGSPDSFSARHPPSSEIAFVYPIFWRLSATNAERKPPPQ